MRVFFHVGGVNGTNRGTVDWLSTWGRKQQVVVGSKEERRPYIEEGGDHWRKVGGWIHGWKVDFFIFREINVFGKGTINQPHHSWYTFSTHWRKIIGNGFWDWSMVQGWTLRVYIWLRVLYSRDSKGIFTLFRNWCMQGRHRAWDRLLDSWVACTQTKRCMTSMGMHFRQVLDLDLMAMIQE